MTRNQKTTIGIAVAAVAAGFFILKAAANDPPSWSVSCLAAIALSGGTAFAVYNALLAALERTTSRIALRDAKGGSETIPEFIALARILRSLMREADEKVEIIHRDRAFLASLFDNLEEGILCIGERGSVVFQNETMPESIAQRRSIGRSYLEVLKHPDALVIVRSILNGDAANPAPILLHSRGRDYRASIRHTDGLILIIVYDVTEEERTLRIRREFFENASHELKTPLTSIQGYAEIMAGRSTDDTSRRAADAIVRNAERMTRLVSDMSEITLLESGRIALNRVDVPLNDFFSNIVILTAGTLQARRQTIVVRCDQEMTLNADPVFLEHVLLNLIDNASRYSPEGTQIETGAVDKGQGVVVFVEDRGPGIPPDLRERIFERFFRIDPDRSRSAGGTGLGLSIVRHIAKIHSGRAWVEGREGGGSIFYAFLPHPTQLS